jgi:recombination protein RecA
MSELDRVLASLNKKYGKAIINPADQIKYPAVQRLSTRSLSLDLELGGGYPCGRVIMVVGNESSGKTTLILHAIAEAQKEKKKVVFIDAEGTFDAEWAKVIGVDLSKLSIVLPDNGEQAADVLEAVVRSNDCALVILDSIAALMPKAELEISMEDDPERLGNKAQMLNRAMRRLTSALNEITEMGERNQTTIILLNQFREKIGIAYGNPEVIPGGKGIKFASSIILELRKGEWIEAERNGEKVKIGQQIKFKTSKNKTYSPLRTGSTYLYFDGDKKGQLDKTQEIYTYGKLLGLIKVDGQMTYFGDKKIRGADAAIDFLREDLKLQEKLEKEIRQRYLKTNEEK